MSHADVIPEAIRSAVKTLGLSGRPVCVHSSLRSFGKLIGGADAFVDAFLSEDCTLLVPTFSWDSYKVAPPGDLRPERNGYDYEQVTSPPGTTAIFTPESPVVDEDMGAIPAAVVRRSGRRRGNNPLVSFCAVGSLAQRLVDKQSSSDAFTPLEQLAQMGGSVLLVGVDLRSMTLLHLAERHAGRVMPRRWALNQEGQTIMVEVGGCSEGFGKLEPILGPITQRLSVGPSRWQAFPAAASLATAAAAIRQRPEITVCGDPSCRRCKDSVLGGPLL
jgi:aminoglycoside 3-N-acetyltransferase